jgi:hypothetical protein
MRVFTAGHIYELDSLDGPCEQRLVFVKREGDKYPGNVGTHPGTNVQDVLRALIDRVKYLDGQMPCVANKLVLSNLRYSILLLEERAAARHKRRPDWRMYDKNEPVNDQIEYLEWCSICGHIGCGGTCR